MPARFCSQCGQEVSSTAKFCPNCAAPLSLGSPAGVAAPPNVTTHPLDAAAQKSRSLLPAAIAAVVVLAAALIFLAARSRQQASLLVSPAPIVAAAPAVTNAPQAPPTAAPALTNAPQAPPMTAPAVTNAPDKPTPSLPPDVAAYLTFLQGIEQKRIAMNNDVSGATAMLGIAQGMQSQGMKAAESDADDPYQSGSSDANDASKQSTQKLSQGYSNYAAQWQALVRQFRSQPPPPACTQLAARYLTFLGDYTTVISKMQVALLNHDQSGLPDLSAVTQVQAQVSTDGAQADTALGDLCARYGVPKPFVISPEGAAPSLLGH